MKRVILFFYFLFFSVSYSQSDEIKLWEQKEPLYGKVTLIKSSSIEFKQDLTGLLFEFDKKDINYLKPSASDTIWLNQRDGTITKRATIFLSYNFLGEHKPSLNTASHDVNSGISAGLEFDFIKIVRDAVKFGIGAMYQFSRRQINGNGNFNFIPLYAFFKLGMVNEAGFEDDEKFKMYLIPTIGYNFFYGDKKYTGDLDLNGGIYNSVGLGMLIRNKLDVKLLYQFNRGSFYDDELEKETKINYKSFGLHCGYYF